MSSYHVWCHFHFNLCAFASIKRQNCVRPVHFFVARFWGKNHEVNVSTTVQLSLHFLFALLSFGHWGQEKNDKEVSITSVPFLSQIAFVCQMKEPMRSFPSHVFCLTKMGIILRNSVQVRFIEIKLAPKKNTFRRAWPENDGTKTPVGHNSRRRLCSVLIFLCSHGKLMNLNQFHFWNTVTFIFDFSTQIPLPRIDLSKYHLSPCHNSHKFTFQDKEIFKLIWPTESTYLVDCQSSWEKAAIGILFCSATVSAEEKTHKIVLSGGAVPERKRQLSCVIQSLNATVHEKKGHNCICSLSAAVQGELSFGFFGGLLEAPFKICTRLCFHALAKKKWANEKITEKITSKECK